MVRFFWHVEGGYSAYIPPRGMTFHKDTAVRHADCEIEIPGQKETLPAVITLPPDYLKEGAVKDVGIVLGHGSNAAEWKGKFLTELAVVLASEGFVVMRCCCKQKEQRRQRMYEKALDACATSPFGRTVTRWVLAGFGNGARVAAVVGSRCRGTIAGFVMLAYPLLEPLALPNKTKKGATEPPPPPQTSEAPLLKIQRPVLFMVGDVDEVCPVSELKEVASRMPSSDVRLAVISECDSNFRAPGGRGPSIVVVRQIAQKVVDFVCAVQADTLSSCSIPQPAGFGTCASAQPAEVQVPQPRLSGRGDQPSSTAEPMLPSSQPPVSPLFMEPPFSSGLAPTSSAAMEAVRLPQSSAHVPLHHALMHHVSMAPPAAAYPAHAPAPMYLPMDSGASQPPLADDADDRLHHPPLGAAAMLASPPDTVMWDLGSHHPNVPGQPYPGPGFFG